MTAAVFGLIGVIIGGTLNGTVAWLMERRREGVAARKAARLVTRAFTRCRFILELANKKGTTWGAVAREIDEALVRWPDHADVLAGTVTHESMWLDIVGAAEHLQRIQQRGHASPDEDISAEDREFLGYVAEIVWQGGFASGLIGVAGPRPPRRFWRRIWRRLRRIDEDAQARELVQQSYVLDGKTPPERDDDVTEPPSSLRGS